MTNERMRPSVRGGGRLWTTLVALSLLAAGSPAEGAEGARLDLFHGPDDTGMLNLKELRMQLDGEDLGISVPPANSDPEKAIVSRTIEPGVHELEVEAALEGSSPVFRYMDGYRIKMRSLFELEVLEGKPIAIRSRILGKGGITTRWEERKKIVLTLSEAGGPATPLVAVATDESESPPGRVAPSSPKPSTAKPSIVKPSTAKPTSMVTATEEPASADAAEEPAVDGDSAPAAAPPAPGSAEPSPAEQAAGAAREPGVDEAASAAAPPDERAPAAKSVADASPTPEPAPAQEPTAAQEPVAAQEATAAQDAAPEPEPAPGARAAVREPVSAPRAEPVRRKRVAAVASSPRAAKSPASDASPAAQAPSAASKQAHAAAPGDCRTTAVRFEFAKATLTPEAEEELGRFAACLAGAPGGIRVEGHADSRGNAQFNRWLAWDRAAAVSTYLREHGLADRRVRTRSSGADRPLCGDTTKDCYARNRRVEVITAE